MLSEPEAIKLILSLKTKVIANDNLTNFWKAGMRGIGVVGIPHLEDSEKGTILGKNFLNITVPKGRGDAIIYHEFQKPLDLSTYKSVVITFCGSNTKADVLFELHSDYLKDWYQYKFSDNMTGWRVLVIPFSSFKVKGNPTLSNITRFEFVFKESTRYRIDAISISKEEKGEKGSTRIKVTSDVIIADKIILPKGIIELPKVKLSIRNYELKKGEKIVGYYAGEGQLAPFATSMKIGKGEIIKIEMTPYYQYLITHPGDEKAREIFLKLGNILRMFNLDLAQAERSRKWREIATLFGHSRFSNITLTTNSLLFDKTHDLKGKIKELGEVEIDKIQVIGNTKFVLKTSNVVLAPSGIGPYARMILTERFTLIIKLGRDAEFSINGELMKKGPGELTLTSEENRFCIVYARLPKIVSVGISNFERVRISETYGIYGTMIEFGVPLHVEGKVVLKVASMDQLMVLLSDIEIEGIYKKEIVLTPIGG
jgi:hypothetical protein